MNFEIERRWLVKDKSWCVLAEGKTLIRQGYLHMTPERTERIRFETNQPAIFCIKGLAEGLKTPEHETRVTPAFAKAVWDMCGKYTLQKLRHRVAYKDRVIEVDEFLENLDGLYLAEVEFPSEDTSFDPPNWFGIEVTDDRRYRNAMLVQHGIPAVT